MNLDLSIGPILLPAFLLGWIQGVKELFDLEGRAARWVGGISAAGFTAMAWGMQEELIPVAAHPYITWVVVSLAGFVTALGYYSLWRDGFRDRGNGPNA